MIYFHGKGMSDISTYFSNVQENLNVLLHACHYKFTVLIDLTKGMTCGVGWTTSFGSTFTYLVYKLLSAFIHFIGFLLIIYSDQNHTRSAVQNQNKCGAKMI